MLLLTYEKEGWGIDFSDTVAEQCAELYLRVAMALHEYDKGIKYFRKHLPKWNPEVDLYRLLQILYGHTDDNPQLSETWIEIYDKAVERGIAPRQQLAEMREEIQEELAARDR